MPRYRITASRWDTMPQIIERFMALGDDMAISMFDDRYVNDRRYRFSKLVLEKTDERYEDPPVHIKTKEIEYDA